MPNLPIINTAIFIAVAFLHVLRLAYQSPVIVGPMEIPLWFSALAVVGAATIAYLNWHNLSQHGKPQWLRLLLALVVIDAAVLLASWAMQLSYWSLSGDTFLWFVIIDAVLVGIILQALRKRGSA